MNIDVYRSLVDFDESKRAIEFEAVVKDDDRPNFDGDDRPDLDWHLYGEPESYSI